MSIVTICGFHIIDPYLDMIGPSLFIFYISDVPESLWSSFCVIDDDPIVYLIITSDADGEYLQRDLTNLAPWEAKWKHAFTQTNEMLKAWTEKVNHD